MADFDSIDAVSDGVWFFMQISSGFLFDLFGHTWQRGVISSESFCFYYDVNSVRGFRASAELICIFH